MVTLGIYPKPYAPGLGFGGKVIGPRVKGSGDRSLGPSKGFCYFLGDAQYHPKP